MKSRRREYQLALISGKKTLLRKKKPLVYFIPILDEEGYPTGKYETKDVKKYEPCDYPLNGADWHHADLFGEKAVEKSEPYEEGNVVLGFCTISSLILDVDLQTEERVFEFADNYAEFQGLGSSLVTKTSDSSQIDLFGKNLANWGIVFGKPEMSWEEISWHLAEARRLGMIKRVNAVFARFGYITERVNAKNREIPPPKIAKFFPHGEMRAIKNYVVFLNRFRNIGL